MSNSTVLLVVGAMCVAVVLFAVAGLAMLMVRKATIPKETRRPLDADVRRPVRELPRPNAEE